MPRGVGRGLAGHKAGHSHARVPVAWMLLTVLLIAGVSWLQLTRYEARLHSRLQREAEEAQQAATHEEQGYPTLQASLKQGPQRTSQLCVAMLEASGVLPDVQGRRQGGAAGADLDGSDDGGGTATADPAVLGRLLSSRRRLYDSMESSLLDKGLALEAATQGMGLGDVFRRGPAGELQPVLQALEVPVRAIVLPLLDRQAASVLEAAVRRHLDPLLPANGIWLQDSAAYHSTIYHASSHFDPVPASPAEVDGEEEAIRAVGASACPLKVVLERVVATPNGAVLACWQVAGGTDVFELRRQLAAALPGASKRQVVQDGSILHTTLARLVEPPRLDDASGGSKQQQQQQQGAAAAAGAAGAADTAATAEEGAVLLQAAIDRMTSELCGLQAVLQELWFAEEFDKLALGLRGHYRQRPIPLQCGKGGGGRQVQQARRRL